MIRSATLVFIALLAGGALTQAAPVEHSIDVAHSKAQFTVSHVFVESVGGSIPILKGTVLLDGSSTIPVSVWAVLDATHLRSGDDDRDASLQGPDFFDTKRFPTWTFASTKITARSRDSFEIDGLLTIHGVSRPERLDVSAGGDAAHPVYHVSAHVDRHAFGMAITRLDPAIGSDVLVDLSVQIR